MTIEGDEKNLRQIESWVNQSKISLLAPIKILEEWNRQKVEKVKEIEKLNKETFTKVKASTKAQIKTDFQRILQKRARIDDLLYKAIKFDTSRDAHAEINLRFEQGRPPFHNNRKSHGDANWFFSTIYYAEENKIREIILVTANINEFSKDRETAKYELHPDLVFPLVNMVYYIHIASVIHSLKDELGLISDYHEAENDDYVSQFKVFTDTGNYTLVEQVYNALTSYQDQLTFIPSHILSRLFPIKTASIQYNYTYHSSFAINSNNEALVRFFASIDIDEANVLFFREPESVKHIANSQNYVLTILKKLNQNLIYNINHVNGTISADIRLKKEGFCDCLKCSYKRLDFLKAYSLLEFEPSDDLASTVKQAYIHFQFGNFLTSLKLFYHVFKEAKAKHKSILGFICLYNLKRLNQYIKGYTSDYYGNKIVREVDKLSIKRYLLVMQDQTPFCIEVCDWINEEKFFYQSHKEIMETLKKIRDHYHLQMKGGWSRNSNFEILISQFGEIEFFLDTNYIIFDNYSDFQELTNDTAEGLLLHYSFNKKQDSRLEQLDEFLLLKLIIYGSRQSIIKYWNRLHLRSMRFYKQQDYEPTLTAIALRFFRDFHKLKEQYTNNDEGAGYFFWNKYYNIFTNLLLILSLSDSQDDLSEITHEVLEVIRSDAFTYRLEDNVISDFLNRKGKQINKDTLLEFLREAVRNPKLHNGEIFSVFYKLKKRYSPDFELDDAPSLGLVEDNFLKRCPSCNSYHYKDSLVFLYNLVPESFRIRIQEAMINSLVKEFNEDLYYTLVIYGIIDYHPLYAQFIGQIKLPKKGESTLMPFHKGVADFPILNKLINLAYKFDVDLSDTLYDQYRGVSPYYDWLLDLENFNYEQFDPEWILEYKTDLYFKKIFQTHKVKEFLKKYLKKEKHPYLSQLFVEYTQ